MRTAPWFLRCTPRSLYSRWVIRASPSGRVRGAISSCKWGHAKERSKKNMSETTQEPSQSQELLSREHGAGAKHGPRTGHEAIPQSGLDVTGTGHEAITSLLNVVTGRSRPARRGNLLSLGRNWELRRGISDFGRITRNFDTLGFRYSQYENPFAYLLGVLYSLPTPVLGQCRAYTGMGQELICYMGPILS